MAFFSKKEDKPSTAEEVRRAYQNLPEDERKHFDEFHHGYLQSIDDRVHESVAAQEREHGQEDSQSAEAREHEALGAEHADGKGDVEELHEQDDTPEEKREDKADDDRYKDLESRVEALEARFKDDGDSDKEAAEKAEKVYGVHSGVFASNHDVSEKITPKEAAQIARAYRT